MKRFLKMLKEPLDSTTPSSSDEQVKQVA